MYFTCSWSSRRNKGVEYEYSGPGSGRPAVENLASPQQAPGRLHEEAWAGLSQKQGLRISQEVEIVPGCAVCSGLSVMS